MPDKMKFRDFIKGTICWLWPSLVVITASCIRKSVFISLSFEQIGNGLLLYAVYLFCIIPAGYYLSKLKWFEDESKTALLILFFTYFFFEYSTIFSSWWTIGGSWAKEYFYDKQDTLFILLMILFVLGFVFLLGKMDDKKKNKKVLIFTTLVITLVPYFDVLSLPDYKFESDLYNMEQYGSNIDKTKIPRRIFWIILDERPSSFTLNEVWGFKDTAFIKGLESLGFSIYDSSVSNYNSTMFSLASTAYGSMLPINSPQLIHTYDDSILAKRIVESPVLQYLKSKDYETKMLTFFDASYTKYFARHGEIVNTSFAGMILYKYNNQYAMSQVDYNRSVIDSLSNLLKYIPASDKRLFAYAHILMPHGPYLPLREEGISKSWQLFKIVNDDAFLDFVSYTDSVILNLLKTGLDNLSDDDKSNTLIILQADHGPRYLEKGGKDLRWRSSFGIFNAVLWSKNSRKGFYNGMSSVNTFRILFRDLWGINLDLLKDTCINVSPILTTED